MTTSEADLEALRKAGLAFLDVGQDVYSFASYLDEDPLYLRSDDWGYTGRGGGKDVPAAYERIRADLRDYLYDGSAVLWAVGDSIRQVAARYAGTELSNREELERLHDDIPGPETPER